MCGKQLSPVAGGWCRLGEYSQECCWLVTGYSWIWLIPAKLLNSSGWLFPAFPKSSCAVSACSWNAVSSSSAEIQMPVPVLLYLQSHSIKWSENVVGWATKSSWNSKFTCHWNVIPSASSLQQHKGGVIDIKSIFNVIFLEGWSLTIYVPVKCCLFGPF